MISTQIKDFDRLWWKRNKLPERFRNLCRATCQLPNNYMEIEFEDGFVVKDMAWATRLIKNLHNSTAQKVFDYRKERRFCHKIPTSWTQLRRFIWRHRAHICEICLRSISYEEYECGHRVDRVCGGRDHWSNLAIMCGMCNQVRKPLFETLEAYYSWLEETHGKKTF